LAEPWSADDDSVAVIEIIEVRVLRIADVDLAFAATREKASTP
jgi:uncharacterized protein YhfF